MNKLSSFTSLFGQALTLTKNKAKDVYIIAVLSLLITFSGLLFLIASRFLGSIVFIISAILFLCLLIYLIYFSIWSQLAMYFVFTNNVTWRQAYKLAKQRGVRKYFSLNVSTAIIVLLWTLLFIIPGIIFSIYYCLAGAIFVIESLNGKDARRKSKEYVRGLWWAVFGRYVFFGLIMILLYLPVILLNIFLPETSGSNPVDTLTWATVVDNLYNGIIGILIFPLYFAFNYVLYQDIRRVKEIIPVPQNTESE